MDYRRMLPVEFLIQMLPEDILKQLRLIVEMNEQLRLEEANRLVHKKKFTLVLTEIELNPDLSDYFKTQFLTISQGIEPKYVDLFHSIAMTK
jgi:hypothetical protein